ncbi:MAG TPA: hypothetical protein VHC70_04295 [Phycisphaerales bacterium]|nr:hypothetical protein [Phycisphaerales bacterium]
MICRLPGGERFIRGAALRAPARHTPPANPERTRPTPRAGSRPGSPFPAPHASRTRRPGKRRGGPRRVGRAQQRSRWSFDHTRPRRPEHPRTPHPPERRTRADGPARGRRWPAPKVGYSGLKVGCSGLKVGCSGPEGGYSRLKVGYSGLKVGYSSLRVGYSRLERGYSRLKVGYASLKVGYAMPQDPTTGGPDPC